jgi:predicted DNA-binding transcriptional regulator AlpA
MDTTVDSALNQVQPHTRSLCALPEILQRIKASKSAVYVWMAQGRFPRACVVLGPRYSRWSVQDIDAWVSDPAAWIAANSKVAE